MESFNFNNMYHLGYFYLISDGRVQCPRVGLDVKIYDTSAGGIRASRGTFSSLICLIYLYLLFMYSFASGSIIHISAGSETISLEVTDQNQGPYSFKLYC